MSAIRFKLDTDELRDEFGDALRKAVRTALGYNESTETFGLSPTRSYHCTGVWLHANGNVLVGLARYFPSGSAIRLFNIVAWDVGSFAFNVQVDLPELGEELQKLGLDVLVLDVHGRRVA